MSVYCHYKCNFKINDDKFTSMEQYVMVRKARKFGDMETVANLFQTDDPKEQKYLGKHVTDYKHQVWMKEVDEIVYQGLCAKFSQSSYLRKFLLDTGKNLLVEASLDTVWGVGITSKYLGSKNKKVRIWKKG